MSDQPDKSEKTEDPSQRKLEEARKKGDVAKSQELTTWFMTLGSTLLFALMAPIVASQLVIPLRQVMDQAGDIDLMGPGFANFVNGLAFSIVGVAILPLVFLAVFAIAGNLVQHAPLLSIDPIKPKWSRVSPLAGAKRLFSSEALVNFVKGLLKISVVSIALFAALWPEIDRLESMISSDLGLLLPIFLELALKVFGVAIAIVTVIAAADYVYQRYKYWERQKMTVKEVKDEYKQMEGDPHIKQRIRQIRNEKARQRMMQAVPQATVVITNPTHYAVALKYERGMKAPVCLAKGVDAVALRIRKLADEHSIPIVENPPLARALFASVDIDEAIPADHFKAVAEVIGYVLKLNGRRRWRA
jgi:flagellar biosynthetic protein FlhB